MLKIKFIKIAELTNLIKASENRPKKNLNIVYASSCTIRTRIYAQVLSVPMRRNENFLISLNRIVIDLILAISE